MRIKKQNMSINKQDMRENKQKTIKTRGTLWQAGKKFRGAKSRT